MKRRNKTKEKSCKLMLKELPYFSYSGDLSKIHGRFNNSFSIPWKSKRDLDKLTSLYDIDLFSLNTTLDYNLNPFIHGSTNYLANIFHQIVFGK